jgi:curved DNA-binding protein CbpA
MIRTHYDNLQVTRNASEVVIRAAYKSLAQKNHPDKFDGGRDEAERIMKILNEAYTVLSDPARRKLHNEWIDQETAAENARLRAAMAEYASGASGAHVHASTGPSHQRSGAGDVSGRQHTGRRNVKKARLSPKAKGHLCLFCGLLCAVLALRNAASWNFADRRAAVSFFLAFLVLIPFAVAYYRNAIVPAKSVTGSVALLVIFFGLLMFGGMNMILHGDVWYGLVATLAFGWTLATMYRG